MLSDDHPMYKANGICQVNVPKTRRTYCKGKDCKKHTQHKVTQYKAGKVRNKSMAVRAGANNINP